MSSPTPNVVASKVKGIIDDNPVAVFSKSYCPYCRAAKKLLTDNGASFFALELDQVGVQSADDGAEIQSHLATLTGQSTVPNIFINKIHIGGNSDLQGKKNELPDLLKAANAI